MKILNFLKNCFRFRKELTNFEDFDYSYNLALFRHSLELTKNRIEVWGNEIDEDRLPKVKKMERAIYLLERFEKNDFIELTEEELGYTLDIGGDNLFEVTEDDCRIFKRSSEMEEEMWRELWEIIEQYMRGFWD